MDPRKAFEQALTASKPLAEAFEELDRASDHANGLQLALVNARRVMKMEEIDRNEIREIEKLTRTAETLLSDVNDFRYKLKMKY